MDKFKIDSQKIAFHPERIAQWLEAKDDWEKAKKVYPLYVEFTPAGHCNHRCVFCGVDYLGYKKSESKKDILLERIKEMGAKGVKSAMLAGDGEPLLSPDIPVILRAMEESGIDSAVTTNLTALDDDQALALMKHCQWVKVSLNGGNPEVYAQMHRTSKRQFSLALQNMEKCANLKKRLGLKATLGAQTVLLPENMESVKEVLPVLKEIGVDYYTIKPFSQHSFSLNRRYENLRYEGLDEIESLSAHNDKNFQFIFRKNAFRVHDQNKISYKSCSATPFMWAYVMGNGDVYACSAYLKQDEFYLGNLFEQTFEEIWEGERRRACFEHVTKKLDISACRRNCRMNSVNEYLDRFNNPPEHLNFI